MADQNDLLDGLEERLRNNSKAFESILALTPAQEHYGTAILDGRDPSEQWRAKKQTKAEKKAARKAKLDPANQKSVLDIMKERERKRKRELGIDDEEAAEEGTNAGKRVKSNEEKPADEAARQALAEKRRQKRERKKERNEKLKVKADAKKARRQARAAETADAGDENVNGEEGSDVDEDVANIDVSGLADDAGESEDDAVPGDEQIEELDAASDASTAPSSPTDSPVFDVSASASIASSSSSIPPPSAADTTSQKKALPKGQTLTKPPLSISLPEPPTQAAILKESEKSSRTSSPKPQLPKIDQAILQERLRKRIEELRAKRKADGAEGRPAQTRHELLEQRRKKAEQRKAHKKELRRQAKDDEARKQEERLRGSGSPLSGADIFSPRSESNSFSFSRLAFSDGTSTDASLSKLTNAPKQKGPQDVKTALIAAENKQKRLSGLDEHKRADIGEKDMWLNASKRAHGERVRDDTSLLKKALKRKEKQKGKSEREWQERGDAVVKGKEMKQKRREDNLAKRKEEKGGKKKAPKKGGKRRPGFEGRFKA